MMRINLLQWRKQSYIDIIYIYGHTNKWMVSDERYICDTRNWKERLGIVIVIHEMSSILVPRRRALNRRPTIFLILLYVHICAVRFIAISFFLVRLIAFVPSRSNDKAIEFVLKFSPGLHIGLLLGLDHLLCNRSKSLQLHAKRTHTYIR